MFQLTYFMYMKAFVLFLKIMPVIQINSVTRKLVLISNIDRVNHLEKINLRISVETLRDADKT